MPPILWPLAELFCFSKPQPSVKSENIMAYKVEIRLVKIDQATGAEQLGANFFAGDLDFKQAEACIKEAQPVLDALRNDWLSKDVE